MEHTNPAGLRRTYHGAPLRRRSLADHPMAQFHLWFEEAHDAGLPEPNAMVLSSVEPSGMPRGRTVLMKGHDSGGLRFFTNYTSRKGRALEADPRACVVFPWHPIRRQVLMAGRVERLDDEESDRYFASRPRGSRIGAWASEHQSAPVAGRPELEHLYAEFDTVWEPGRDIPRPNYWGGFRLVPEEVEFWQGGADRMHDRFRYLRVPAEASVDGGQVPVGDGQGSPGDREAWVVERLAP